MTVQATDRGGKAATPPIELTPIIVISIGIFVTTFDMTAVIMVMPKIKETMNLDIGGFAWVMDSYSLAFTVFLMTAGVLADRYGRRRAMLVGNATFLGASVLCGFAQDEVVLLIGRVAQGIGAAFIVCSGLALVGHRYIERSESARAFALLGSISGGAMALGPAGGGMVADLLGWQWVFFINIPICLFVAFALPRVLAESSDPARRRIDTLGLLALSSFLVSAVWFLLHGSRVGTVAVPLWLTLGWVTALAGLFLLTQRRPPSRCWNWVSSAAGPSSEHAWSPWRCRSAIGPSSSTCPCFCRSGSADPSTRPPTRCWPRRCRWSCCRCSGHASLSP